MKTEATRRAQRKIELDTPCTIEELARFIGAGVSTIYRHRALGYQFQYPRIKRTTPRHYLAWASEEQPQESPETKARREHELHRLHSDADKSHAQP